jgi:hypothetical protein
MGLLFSTPAGNLPQGGVADYIEGKREIEERKATWSS